MRKIILALILSLFTVNVYAEACSPWEIEGGQASLENLTFNLEYLKEGYYAPNGSFSDGYFKITFPNLPDGYYVLIETSLGPTEIGSKDEFAISNGQVSKVQLYAKNCDTILKSFEIKIPFYKSFCYLDKDCENNVWFDGTYENKPENLENKTENKVSIRLIIILVVLIAIVVGCLVFAIRKRRLDAQDL